MGNQRMQNNNFIKENCSFCNGSGFIYYRIDGPSRWLISADEAETWKPDMIDCEQCPACNSDDIKVLLAISSRFLAFVLKSLSEDQAGAEEMKEKIKGLISSEKAYGNKSEDVLINIYKGTLTAFQKRLSAIQNVIGGINENS